MGSKAGAGRSCCLGGAVNHRTVLDTAARRFVQILQDLGAWTCQWPPVRLEDRHDEYLDSLGVEGHEPRLSVKGGIGAAAPDDGLNQAEAVHGLLPTTMRGRRGAPGGSTRV